MPITPEVQATIDMIDNKIAKLQQTKELLLSEFSNSSNGARATRPEAETHTLPTQLIKGNRKAQITDFIRHNGPMRRRDIVEKTGIPIGTVAYVLNDDQVFRQSHGKWDLRRELKEQPQQD